jgi:putative ABC transport system permease protein
MLSTFYIPIGLLLVMGVFIPGIVFSMSLNERQREIGLFRAVVARKLDIFRIMITESLIISLFGGISGILFGGSLVILFKNKIMGLLELLYIWPSPRVIFTVILVNLVMSISIGIIVGFYPAMRAANMEPYNAVRTGER